MLKLAYKNQLRDAAVVVKHIESYNGEWAPITLKIIKEITGVNTCYASGVYQTLKQNEGLESRMVYVPSHGGHRKMEFRPKPARLTKENIDFVSNQLCSHGISNESKEMTMTVIHFLASIGAAEGFVQDYMQKTADMLIMKRAAVLLYINMLIRYGVAEGGHDRIRLILSTATTEQAINEITPLEVEDHVAPVEEAPETIQTKEDELMPSPRQLDLSEDLMRFGDIIEGFQNFFSGKADQVITEYKAISGNRQSLETLLGEKDEVISALTKELELKNSQLEEGNNVLKTLAEDNASLRQQDKKHRKEIEKQSRLYRFQKDHNEQLFSFMQERLQIMIADINGTVVDYTRIPAYQVKPADTARVQNTIITAITTAVGDIVQADANGFSEDEV